MTAVAENTAQCRTCLQNKPESEFYTSKGRLASQCKACTIVKIRQYNEETKKTCEACGESKPLKQFPIRKQKPFTRMHKCRDCVKQKRIRVRVRTPESGARRKNRVLAKKKFILMYLKDHPCVDCGETDPVVLEFDHRDPSQKKNGLSALVGRSYSLHTLITEIEKCDVRCSNCHRKKTSKQASWDWLPLLNSNLSDCSHQE